MEKMYKCLPQISGGYRGRLEKKESSKGFTLVELIVVIVILAILAAILIPGLLKWIDEAKEAQYKLEAKAICQAAQAETVKLYAEGKKFKADEYIDEGVIVDTSEITVVFNDSNNKEKLKKIEELSGIEHITWVTITFGNGTEGLGKIKLAYIVFDSSDGKENIQVAWEEDKDKEWHIFP